MPLVSLLLGWAGVALWFIGWELVAARLEGGGRWLRAPAVVYAAEALVIALIGGLWFGSLGAGGWPILFALLGIAIELPLRLRSGGKAILTPRRLLPIAGGALRLVGAGAVLVWRLA